MEMKIYPTYLSRYLLMAELLRKTSDELLANDMFAAPLRELLYIGMVNMLEAYFQDRLYEEVFSSDEKTRNFTDVWNVLHKNDDKGLKISFPLSDEDRKKVENTVLTGIICHKTSMIIDKFFTKISNFDPNCCCKEKETVDEIVKKRNILVHRKGLHNDTIQISYNDIYTECDAIAHFIFKVEAEFQRNNCNWLFDLNPNDGRNEKKCYSEVDDGEYEEGCVDEDSMDKFVYEAHHHKKPSIRK